MKRGPAIALAVLLPAALAFTAVLAGSVGYREISRDPYSNTSSQHETEVEPDTFAYGTTVVAAFQSGRFYGAGASNIGWATSTDGGDTWENGFLPGLTVFSTPAGSASWASDPSVAFDAEHGVWLIASLAWFGSGFSTSVVVSRSTDGTSWSAPVTAASGWYDKPWIACDNGLASPFRGRCYLAWTDVGGQSLVSASSDGGLTWGSPAATIWMLGVLPLIQPDGTLVLIGAAEGSIGAVRSTDGGSTFSTPAAVSLVSYHSPTGMRAPALPTAEVDASGNIYVAWADCRFRDGCSSNDIVMSTSSDGVTWPPSPSRVPIDGITSGVDHFIPGLGVDPATAGTAATVGISFYYFPVASCSADTTCELNAGFIPSGNAGATWGEPVQLNPQPMALSWLADTSQGRMVGDYIATSVVDGRAVAVLAVASPPTGTTLHEAMAAATIPITGPTPTPTPSPTPSPPPNPAGDSDGDGYRDADEAAKGSDPFDSASTPERCDGADNDGDTTLDEAPALSGRATPDPLCAPGVDLDGDTVVNATDLDDDGDGFTDADEQYMSTDELDDCRVVAGHDAWPPDVNADGEADVGDVILLFDGGKMLQSDGQPFYSRRSDADGNGEVNMGDVIQLFGGGNILTTC